MQWVNDWKEYGEPYLNCIKNLEDVVNTLLNIPNYRPNLWVKSSAPMSAHRKAKASILLTFLGRKIDAERLLLEEKELIERQESLGKWNKRTIAFRGQANAKLLDWLATLE